MNILLRCKDGFSYISYQRVEVLVEGVISPSTAWKIAFLANCTEQEEGWLYRDGHSLFVISGESFTLADFADAVQTMLKKEYPTASVSYQDGDDPVEKA